MFRKTTTLLIVLVAGISLLAHVVLPHHHHHGAPCFSLVADCHNHAVPDECCHRANHPNNLSGNDCNSCVLDQLVIVADTHVHGKIYCVECGHHPYSSDVIQAVLLACVFSDFSIPEPPSEFRQPLYILNYHSVFTSRSLGLRAPPAMVA